MKLTFTDDGDSFPEPVSWPKGYSADHFDDDLNLTPNKPQSREPLETDTQPRPAEMPKGKDPQHFDPDMPPLVNTGREVPVVTHLKKGDDFIEAEAAVGIGGGGGTPPSTLGRRAHEEAFGTADAPRTPPLTASRRRRPNPSTPPNTQLNTPRGGRTTRLQPVQEADGMDDTFLNGAAPAADGGTEETKMSDPPNQKKFTIGQSKTTRKTRTREDPSLASSVDEVRQHEKGQAEALETLGLKAGSTKAQIIKAYRKLSHEHHPDKGGDAATMRKINDAYSKLMGDNVDETKAQWVRKNYQHLYMQYYRDNPEFKLTAPMAKALRANTGLKTLKQGMSVADALKIMYDEFGQTVGNLRQLDSRATASVKDRTAGRLATKKMRLPEEVEYEEPAELKWITEELKRATKTSK